MRKISVAIVPPGRRSQHGLRLVCVSGNATRRQPPLSSYVPSGALLYLQAKDFSALLADWNRSPAEAGLAWAAATMRSFPGRGCSCA